MLALKARSPARVIDRDVQPQHRPLPVDRFYETMKLFERIVPRSQGGLNLEVVEGGEGAGKGASSRLVSRRNRKGRQEHQHPKAHLIDDQI